MGGRGISVAGPVSFLSSRSRQLHHEMEEEVMSRIKMLAVTALAAAGVGLGGLAAAPTASAMPRQTCIELVDHYIVSSRIFWAVGNEVMAMYYFGKAESLSLVCRR
jgi:hypothetical protein